MIKMNNRRHSMSIMAVAVHKGKCSAAAPTKDDESIDTWWNNTNETQAKTLVKTPSAYELSEKLMK